MGLRRKADKRTEPAHEQVLHVHRARTGVVHPRVPVRHRRDVVPQRARIDSAPRNVSKVTARRRLQPRPVHFAHNEIKHCLHIDRLLPPIARDAIARGLLRFEQQIRGFAGPEGLLVGLESRSSGPLRLPRDRESYRAEGFDNLYPIGEGAGFAGGIMSAAIDGARAAKRYVKNPCAP